jgi:DNA-binding winged helix-turn-helix (wHTH) protein/Tfp pilus assembly protein PilF
MVDPKGARFALGSFTFVPEVGELSQNNIRVRINPQVADLLLVLVRNAGQLVTRDQIKEALWPDRELLNHDKVITNGISRLRYILNDDASKPRYIESIPKRGYRLVADVRLLDPIESKIFASASPALELEEQPLVLVPPESPFMGVPPEIPVPATYQSWHKRLSPGLASRFVREHRIWVAGALFGLLILAGFLVHWAWAPPEPTGIVSLGIAPFDVSGPGAEELAGSFRLELADVLAQLPQVQVRAAHSLELLKINQPVSGGQVPQLGLDAILFGRFVVDGSIYHLQFELVRGNDMSHIASFQYSGTRNQLAAIRDEVQTETFSHLKLARGWRPAPLSIRQNGTADPEAYEHYLRAHYHFMQQTPDSLRLAVEEYQAAAQQDPKFSKAYAGLANTYIFLWQHDVIDQQEGYRLAMPAIQKALALDASSAEAHAALGAIHYLHDWDLKAATEELQEALRSDSNQPVFHQWLALVLCDEGRFREAFLQIDQAHLEDPLWVSAYITDAHVASDAQDHGRMTSVSHRLMQLMPESSHVRDAVANVEWDDGRFTDAIADWRAAAVIDGDKERAHVEDLGLEAYRRGGVRAYAQIRLKAIDNDEDAARHANDFELPEWYALAGEKAQALSAIRQEVANHDPEILQLAVLPAFASLHSDADFQAILNQLHLSIPKQG